MQVAGRMAELATGKDWETMFQKDCQASGYEKYPFYPG
jgi:hypothetical protein